MVLLEEVVLLLVVGESRVSMAVVAEAEAAVLLTLNPELMVEESRVGESRMAIAMVAEAEAAVLLTLNPELGGCTASAHGR